MSPSIIVGGLEPVDPNSPRIREIAAWAVNEYNKRGHNLKFERVLQAAQQVVAGVMYYIDLEASKASLINISLGNPSRGKYFAKVFVQEWTNTIRLEEFKPLLQAESGLLGLDIGVNVAPLLDVDARIAIPN